MATRGRFVWHDLMTNDPEKSMAFYTRLFGWQTRAMDMGEMGTYTMISASGIDIGGVVALKPSDGVPTHWIGYITADDVDLRTQEAQELGGEIVVPPTDIPDVGRFAVAQDPNGAVFSLFKFKEEEFPESEGLPSPGTVCWNELLTNNVVNSTEFYKTIFGWEVAEQDMGDLGTYHLFRRDGKDTAGMMQTPKEAPSPPFWLPYVTVKDAEEASALAVELGATQTVPATAMPGVGSFSVILDPTGAAIALFQPADVKAQAESAGTG